MQQGLAKPVWQVAICAACKMDLFVVKQAEERIAHVGAHDVVRHQVCGHPLLYRSGSGVPVEEPRATLDPSACGR